MNCPLVVGVDGGNSKTVAAVATARGDVLGAAFGPGSDIYGPGPARGALDVLASVVRKALLNAGVRPAAVGATVASLAGADWPEDYDLYRLELRARVGLGGDLKILNDGVGPLRLANPSGTGVAVALGTGAAVGARGPGAATWHASFWLTVGGSEWLGQRALAAVCQAALGIGPPTSLGEPLMALLGADDEETMLRTLTQRESPFRSGLWQRDAGRIVLDCDGKGDAVARGLVAEQARLIAPYAVTAADKVGLQADYDVVLTGGLLRHPTSVLASRLTDEIKAQQGRARVTTVTVAPVAGALLEAIALAGSEVTCPLVGAISGSGVLAALPQPGPPPAAPSQAQPAVQPQAGGAPLYDAATH